MRQDSEGYSMDVIQLEDILRIYNAYGLTGKGSDTIRFSINTGRMNCQLNTGRVSGLHNPAVSNITQLQSPAITDGLN